MEFVLVRRQIGVIRLSYFLGAGTQESLHTHKKPTQAGRKAIQIEKDDILRIRALSRQVRTIVTYQ